MEGEQGAGLDGAQQAFGDARGVGAREAVERACAAADERDGSAARAKVSAQAPGASPNDIPLLRLKVAARHGSGLLTGVTTIQRLNTHGGHTAAGCESPGTFLSVPYTADYAFYKKAAAMPGLIDWRGHPIRGRNASTGH